MTLEALQEGVQLAVGAGALAARVAKVDDQHLTLMRENITPLLAGDTERYVAEVLASAGR